MKTAMIIFNDVSKRFDETFALEELSFTIKPGELVMFTGHSGSGKTTLMRLLMKEYTPSSGEIIFDETALSKIKSSKIHHHRRKIGVVFQDYKLLPELNVWENIALALSIIGTKEAEIERRVTDLLDLVGLTEKAFLFPAQLSGGEAQRVSIARALSTAPKVIFADEPTGNLDSDTSKNIVSLLKKINGLGTTVMITSHDHNVAEWLGDIRHMVLEKGKIVSDSESESNRDSNKNDEKKSDTKDSKQDDHADKEKKPNASAKNESEKTKQSSSKKSRFGSWFSFLTKPSNDKNTKRDDTKTKQAKESSEKKSKKNNADDTVSIAVEDL